MRTEVIKDSASVIPRLRRVVESGETELTNLESFPFTIGRNDDCDLPINSPKVSRKHAVIIRDGNRFQIRDLGSTNGTAVNGQRVELADLKDGDVLVIADLEFAFVADCNSDRHDTVTMAIDVGSRKGGGEATHRLVRDIRRIHEMLTHRGVRCNVNPIVDLNSGQCFGYQANDPFHEESSWLSTGARNILHTDSRIAEQLCYLNRLIVAEESLCLGQRTNLFLRIHQSEMGGSLLADSLESLSEILEGRHQLVVTVPASAVGPTSYFTELRQRLSEIGARIAYDQFEAGPAQLSQWADDPPDYVKLTPSLSGGGDSERQRQRLTWLLETAAELKIRLVATGLHADSDTQVYRKLGFQLVEGPAFGSQPVNTAFKNPVLNPLRAELVTAD